MSKSQASFMAAWFAQFALLSLCQRYTPSRSSVGVKPKLLMTTGKLKSSVPIRGKPRKSLGVPSIGRSALLPSSVGPSGTATAVLVPSARRYILSPWLPFVFSDTVISWNPSCDNDLRPVTSKLIVSSDDLISIRENTLLKTTTNGAHRFSVLRPSLTAAAEPSPAIGYWNWVVKLSNAGSVDRESLKSFFA